MQGNDIRPFSTSRQAVLWEGLLAVPLPGKINEVRRARALKRESWDLWISLWKTSELPMKKLIDDQERRGIDTDVYTFMGPGAIDVIDAWLTRKGISCRVFCFHDVFDLREDLKYNRSIQRVIVPDEDLAANIGIRAMVCSPDRVWP